MVSRHSLAIVSPLRNKKYSRINLLSGHYICTCVPPWSGRNCSRYDCTAFPCKHRGICLLSGNCACADEWTGPDCSIYSTSSSFETTSQRSVSGNSQLNNDLNTEKHNAVVEDMDTSNMNKHITYDRDETDPSPNFNVNKNISTQEVYVRKTSNATSKLLLYTSHVYVFHGTSCPKEEDELGDAIADFTKLKRFL